MRYSLVCVLALLAGLVLAGCKNAQSEPSIAATSIPEPPADMDMLDPAPADIQVTDNRGTMTPPPPPISSARPLPPVAGTSATGAKTYTVQAGDTFYAISRKVYGSDRRAKDIMACNPGVEPTKLRVGQTLNLPE